MTEVVETDVLVIGGGGAAARASLEAFQRGVRVVMVMKGKFGKCGATAYKVAEIAGYNAADAIVDKNDSPDEHYKDILKAAHGMCDPTLARILADEAPKTIHELESMGLNFEKEDGRYIEIQGCFSTRPRTHIIKGHSEPLLAALKKEIEKTKIKIIEETLISNLLEDNGRCVGAVGITRKGDFIIFKASSISLATGGAGQLFLNNLNPLDITGDGYAMGFRAGAELVNMEYMQAGLGIILPKLNIFNGWIWMLHPVITNLNGEEFIQKYLPPDISIGECMDDKSTHYPFSTFDNSFSIEISIHKEILAGRGSKFGGIFVDLRNVKPELLSSKPRGLENQRMWGVTKKWFLKNGIDPDKELLHISTFGHAINGGMRINAKTETTLSSLYAAGETAGGPHGADRLGGNMIVTCQVFGKRMGFYSAENAIEGPYLGEIQKIAHGEVSRIEELVKKKGSYKIKDLKRRIQKTMWKNVLVVRNESKLNKCIENLSEIRSDLSSKTEISNTNDLWGAIELENLIQTGEIISKAALQRKESRGSHYREDYPSQDDQNWLKNIFIKKEKGDVGMNTGDLSIN